MQDGIFNWISGKYLHKMKNAILRFTIVSSNIVVKIKHFILIFIASFCSRISLVDKKVYSLGNLLGVLVSFDDFFFDSDILHLIKIYFEIYSITESLQLF